MRMRNRTEAVSSADSSAPDLWIKKKPGQARLFRPGLFRSLFLMNYFPQVVLVPATNLGELCASCLFV